MRVWPAATCDGAVGSCGAGAGSLMTGLSALADGMTSSMPTWTLVEVTPGLARSRSTRSIP